MLTESGLLCKVQIPGQERLGYWNMGQVYLNRCLKDADTATSQDSELAEVSHFPPVTASTSTVLEHLPTEASFPKVRGSPSSGTAPVSSSGCQANNSH